MHSIYRLKASNIDNHRISCGDTATCLLDKLSKRIV